MKHILIISLCLLALVSSVFGQTYNVNSEAPVQAELAIIWSHDCNIESCSDWSFDNGATEVGAPWEGIDLNFECTYDGPSGPSNGWIGGTADGSAAPAMNSTTSSNGIILIDSDLYWNSSAVENSWFQTVAPIDCSGHPYVSISMQTRYRYWDELSTEQQCFIEVSRDGISWPAIETRDEASGYVIYGSDTVPSRKVVFPGYSTADMSDNPSILEFDITDAAGGQAEVYIRFRWSGTWGYSWEIDDIKVYDTPANDTRLDNYLSYTDYERSGYYEYGAWPLSQIPADLAAAAKVYNVGFEDQTNVTLDVTAAGTTSSSYAINLASTTSDTLAAAYLPTALGPVTVDYLLTADAADENPENNMASQSFEVTEFSWGRDDGTPSNAAPEDGTDNFIALSLFDIVDDVVIYGIDVAIMDGSESGTSIISHLFNGFDDNFLAEQYGGILQSTDEFDIVTGNTNEVGVPVTNWYTMVFDEPYLASAGDWLGAGFEHYGGSNVQYGESKYTQDNTAFIYGPFGAGSAYDWYYTNEVPMVRLNLNPDAVNPVCIACCLDPVACNYNIPEDDNCLYPIDIYGSDNLDCDGNCLNDADMDYVCDEDEISGCTDYEAFNYNPEATDSDNTLCIYFVPDCNSFGDPGWLDTESGTYPGQTSGIFGEMYNEDIALHISTTIVEPESGVSYALESFDFTSMSGLPEGLTSAISGGPMNPNSQVCVNVFGIPIETGVFDILLTGEALINVFGNAVNIGVISFTHTIEIGDNPNPISGCTYPGSDNYLVYAMVDDGSCILSGCTDPEANNYNLLFNLENGTCLYGTFISDCIEDLNQDGTIGTPDLLQLLSAYGQICE
jgi:hypothetical protein